MTSLQPDTVNQYLEAVPEPARTALKRVRATIRSVAPAESTEVISYRMPMFKYKGMLVAFAAFKDHCSLFVNPGVIQAFREELKGFQTSKGTIRFTVDKPLPAALLKKLVKAKINQNDQRKKMARLPAAKSLARPLQ